MDSSVVKEPSKDGASNDLSESCRGTRQGSSPEYRQLARAYARGATQCGKIVTEDVPGILVDVERQVEGGYQHPLHLPWFRMGCPRNKRVFRQPTRQEFLTGSKGHTLAASYAPQLDSERAL
jgi:hypothetical protein